jgi:multiple sugar transport system ATP-binding protein
MGRDVSVVSTHPASLNPVVRAIVDADYKISKEFETIRFSLKPHKVFLFDSETEERIYFEV